MAYQSKTKFPEISNPSKTSYCHVDPEEVKKGLRPACSVHVHKVIATAAVDVSDVTEDSSANSALSAAEYLKSVESSERSMLDEARKAQRSDFEQRQAELKEEEDIIASLNSSDFETHLKYGAVPAATVALSVLDKYDFYSDDSDTNVITPEDEQAVLEAVVISVAVAEKSKRENLGLVNDEQLIEAEKVRQLLFKEENLGDGGVPVRLPVEEQYDYQGNSLGYKVPASPMINFLYGMKNNSWKNKQVRDNIHELLTSKLDRPIQNVSYADKPRRGLFGLFNRN